MLAAGPGATDVWRGQVTPVPQALPPQPAGAVGANCARGVPDPNDIYTPGH